MLELDRGQNRHACTNRPHRIIATANSSLPDDRVGLFLLEPQDGEQEQELERPYLVAFGQGPVECEDRFRVPLEIRLRDHVVAEHETLAHIEQVRRGETADAQASRFNG